MEPVEFAKEIAIDVDKFLIISYSVYPELQTYWGIRPEDGYPGCKASFDEITGIELFDKGEYTDIFDAVMALEMLGVIDLKKLGEKLLEHYENR